MKLRFTFFCLILALVAVSGAAVAAIPAVHKLDAQLAAIATAAAQNRAEPLMARALSQQLFREKSPLRARWNAAAQVQVYLHYRNDIPPRTEDLLALGASGILVSEPLQVVQAWVPADRLNAIASLPEISRITIPRYAVVKRMPPQGALPRTGSVDTQGDQILGAALYRTLTGFNGSGISVGVISDGDDHIASSISTGDLPATIWNDPNDAGIFKSSGDEGTAMMEIVYDLAPGANLGFCGPQTTAEFVTCLTDFATHFGNTKLVIVDDLGFPGVAMFTDDPDFAVPVENFQSSNPGVQLVTAAGNDAQNFWAGSWQPISISQKINGISYTQAQNFGSAANPNTKMSFQVQAGDTVSYLLEWGDPWPSSSGSPPNDPNDYDVVLFSSSGTPLACNQGLNISPSGNPCTQTNSSSTTTPGPQPVQGNAWINNTGSAADVYLEILYATGDGNPDPNLKVLISAQKFQVNMNPHTPAGSIFGQSALAYPAEITVGADSAASPDAIEAYSSQGPVNLTLLNTVRMKPDFVGIDCVQTTGAGSFTEPFCGTSAAAPHIAGLIALLESGFPSQNSYDLLKAGATALGNGSPNGVYGYGLPNAPRSVGSFYPSPLASISSPSGSTTITAGQSVNFSGNCSANGAPGTVSYDWNFGASSGVADSTVQNPSATFQFFGQYTVTLTCTNQFGVNNATPATVSVTVNPATAPPPSSGKSGGGGEVSPLMLLLLLLLGVLSYTTRRHLPR